MRWRPCGSRGASTTASMAQPTLADGLPQEAAEAPDLVSTWLSNDAQNSVAADDATSGFDALGTAGGGHNHAQTTERRDMSDSFVGILQKLGAPPTLLKDINQLQSGPTLQEMKEAHVKRDAAAGEPAKAPELPSRVSHAVDESGVGRTNASLHSAGLKAGDKDGRETSEDTATSPVEYESGRSSSSLFPDGVCAVGEGTLVEQDNFVFPEGDMYEIAIACQITSDMAAAGLTADADHMRDAAEATNIPSPISIPTSPSAAPTTLGVQKPVGTFSGPCTSASPSDALQWPFESGLRPWEDVGKETRKAAEGVSGHQLEDYKKKRIWVVHRVRLPLAVTSVLPTARMKRLSFT